MSGLREKFERVKFQDILAGFTFLAAIPQALYLRRKRPDLWLISEDRNEARDNGFWLYRHIRMNHPEQDCVYAINKESPDYQRVAPLGEVIQFGSYRHWVYYLAAQKNISSQKNGKPNAAVCYVLEVYGLLKNKRAFLQHGVIINDLPWLYYDATKMSLFVCGAKQEYEFIRDTFGYPAGAVQYLGLTRFDGLHDFTVKKNQILVMPTWREWIATPTSKSKKLDDMSAFTSTEYFQSWNALLNSEKISALLERYDMELLFYPHRNMQQYLGEFSTASDRITIADWKQYDVQELLKNSAFLITDYSSISMDFAYMRKPMLYYQFDEEKFRQGQYPEGYFSYKRDGFGPFCATLEDVCVHLEHFMANGLAGEPLYTQREEAFFPLYDTNNCERNYEAIKNMN